MARAAVMSPRSRMSRQPKDSRIAATSALASASLPHSGIVWSPPARAPGSVISAAVIVFHTFTNRA
ncbi:MAG: hypothetical protein WBM72_12060 [Actinomycetota bacterium]